MNDNARPYALDSEAEPLRLECQAKLAGIESHLAYIPLTTGTKVLDAGCGSGSMTRVLAKNVPQGKATGVDIRQDYLNFAKRAAEQEGIRNLRFQHGDIFDLPFADATFDVVWSKYVLQWVNHPERAVAEFKRVTKPGGFVVCCNADNLLVSNHPPEEPLQADIEAALRPLFDPDVGRKMFLMYHEAGFADIEVKIETDRLFSIFGRIDAERRSNIAKAYEALLPYMAEQFGSPAKGEALVERHLAYLDREDTISPCLLYFVRGRVP